MEHKSVNKPSMLLSCFCCLGGKRQCGGRGCAKCSFDNTVQSVLLYVFWRRITPSARRNRQIFWKQRTSGMLRYIERYVFTDRLHRSWRSGN